MPNIGTPEVIIILLIVLVLFGVGRISKLGSELGSAIANFRKESKTENPPKLRRGLLLSFYFL